jgi:Protein of unknown function (DUF2958)
MKLLTADIRERLLRNGRIRQQLELTSEAESDFLPVVKLFTPDAGCTWLLTSTRTIRTSPSACATSALAIRNSAPSASWNSHPCAAG